MSIDNVPMHSEEITVSDAEYMTKRQRLVLLIVAVSGHGIKHIFNAAFFVLLPQIKASLALTNTQIGTLSAFKGIAGGIANIPAGFVGDHFSEWRAEILGGSIVMVSIFALALGAAINFWMAVIAASMYAIAITFWHPAAISSLSREFASRRGFATALHGTGGSVGETVGPILVGFLVVAIGWRLVLELSVIPGVIFGVMIWVLLRSIPTGKFPRLSVWEYVISVAVLLKDVRLLLVLVFAAGFVGGQSTVLTFLPIYLDEDMGASSVTVGLYLALAQVGGIVSQPFLGFVSDRLGRKIVLIPSLVMLGLSFIGLVVVPTGWMFVTIVLIMGAFLFPLMAVVLAAAMDLVVMGAQATTVSLVFGSAVVVSAIAPAIAGIIADSEGTESAFLFAALLVLSTSLLAFITRWEVKD